MSKYESFSKTELEAALQKLRTRYEDLEEAITFYLTHSSAHINSGEVRQDEETLNDMKQEIIEVETILAAVKP